MPVAPDRTAAATDARLCSNHDPPRRADMGGRGHAGRQHETEQGARARASADRIASSRVRPATREGVTP